MRLMVKGTFVRVNDKNWFVYFYLGEFYEVDVRDYKYLFINSCQFSFDDYDRLYVYDYFYTEQEVRKMKLKKLKNCGHV